MKVLLLHPEDSPWNGEWSQTRWDLIVDLGFASRYVYEDWRRRSGTRVLSIYQFAGEMESYRWVNTVLEHGRGRLFDRKGLDWWEILGVWSYQHLQSLYLLEQLRPEISADKVERLAATRPHPFAKILGLLLNRSIQDFGTESPNPIEGIGRKLGALRKLRPAQIFEIAFDKSDPAHQFRRHASRQKKARLSDPVVLLPSAYSNVTRAALAYAGQLQLVNLFSLPRGAAQFPVAFRAT